MPHQGQGSRGGTTATVMMKKANKDSQARKGASNKNCTVDSAQYSDSSREPFARDTALPQYAVAYTGRRDVGARRLS